MTYADRNKGGYKNSYNKRSRSKKAVITIKIKTTKLFLISYRTIIFVVVVSAL